MRPELHNRARAEPPVCTSGPAAGTGRDRTGRRNRQGPDRQGPDRQAGTGWPTPHSEEPYLVAQAPGSPMIPMNRIVPENRSRMANRNGRSKLMLGGADVGPMPMAVAAAASVPSSSTRR
jgi:hypothetical protein